MPLSAVDPARYQALLAAKCARASALLAPFSAPAPAVYPSAPLGFRMRAEFRIWHEGDQLDYVMYRRDDPSTPVIIEHFPIACDRIQRLMPVLRAALRHNAVLRRSLFQVEFLSTLAGDTLVTLVYHRKLQADWEAEAARLAQELGLSLVGRSRGQKIVIGRSFVREALTVQGRTYTYRQYEQAFTQPNAQVNTAMLAWASERGASRQGDLLELYCGNGNFTLPLAGHFDHVIATELAKTSARAARENLEANAISNVHVIRLSAEEVTQALRAERVFRRLADLPRALQEYDLGTIFVDPPRAGLDSQTVLLAADFDAIIYISCNLATLAENLALLCRSHRIENLALFDQFPYTHHMECGVFLLRK